MAKRVSKAQRREVIEQAATELFAAHGYRHTSIEAIAARSEVSVPVVYDHFASKAALHAALLERHFAELRAVWADLEQAGPGGRDLASTLDAWFGYVASHPYAWRRLFRDTTGDPDVDSSHR
jgi:AcrR family transcriptional regulator